MALVSFKSTLGNPRCKVEPLSMKICLHLKKVPCLSISTKNPQENFQRARHGILHETKLCFGNAICGFILKSALLSSNKLCFMFYFLKLTMVMLHVAILSPFFFSFLSGLNHKCEILLLYEGVGFSPLIRIWICNTKHLAMG